MPTLYGCFCRVDLADGVLVAMADSTTVRRRPDASTPDASTRADLADDVTWLERAPTHPPARWGARVTPVAPSTCHVSPLSSVADLRPELAALASTMIRQTLRAWDAADAGARCSPLKRTGRAMIRALHCPRARRRGRRPRAAGAPAAHARRELPPTLSERRRPSTSSAS